MFGALTGHNNQEERIRSAQETARRNVAGMKFIFKFEILNDLFKYLSFYILIGFVLNGNCLGSTSRERINILKTSINCLPSNKPRLAYGLVTPGM